ncbi:hypothetical protein PanWU01x14_358260, partial [Parasponia andersonii]
LLLQSGIELPSLAILELLSFSTQDPPRVHVNHKLPHVKWSLKSLQFLLLPNYVQLQPLHKISLAFKPL